MGIVEVRGAIDLLRRNPCISNLKMVSARFGAMGINIRIGGTKLADASAGKIDETLRGTSLHIRGMVDLLLDVHDYYKANPKADALDLDLNVLQAVASRRINLARDLSQIGEMHRLIRLAGEYKGVGAELTIGGAEISTLAGSPAGFAELLVSIRAVFYGKGKTIGDILGLIDRHVDFTKTARYPLEDLAQL